MRKSTLLTIGVVAGLALSAVMAATFTIQGGYRGSWQVLRAEANEVAASITIASEGDYAQKPAGAVKIGEMTNLAGCGAMLITFAAGADVNDINDSFTWRQWFWAKDNGPAECAGYGTATLGSQLVVLYPNSAAAATGRYWADTISITQQYWPAQLETFDSGNDRMCKMAVDPLDAEWAYTEITDANGTGTQAANVSAYYRILPK